MIAWDESYCTGNKKIDADHKRLFAYVNELEEALKQGVSLEQLTQIVEFMGRYANAHFIGEEALMARVKCPARSANCKAHQAFSLKIRGWFARLADGGSTELVTEIYKETSSWLTDHIVRVDCQLRGCHTK